LLMLARVSYVIFAFYVSLRMSEVSSWCFVVLRPPLKFVAAFIFIRFAALFITAVRSPSMSTGEHHPSRKEALRATTTKEHGAVHTGGGAGTVHMSPGSTGEAAGVVGQPIFGGRGGNSSPAAAEKVAVVVARYGPRPHPKKHN
jgi:hypothetical protein